MTEPPTRALGTRAIRGALWSYGAFVSGRLVVLVSTAILARLLSPKDFGLVALALIFIAALDGIRDLGVSQALVIAPESELLQRANTSFFCGVPLGAALTLVVIGLSPLAASFFHQPRLQPLLTVLGLTLFVRSLGLTHYALAQRSLDFRSRAAAEVADVVVRAPVGVGLALAGLGPWSLVLGYLSGTVAWTLALWWVVRWRPSRRPTWEGLRDLVRFGGALTVLDVIARAAGYIDNVFVGRVLGPTALGLYSLGYRIPELLVPANTVGDVVLFPAFAAVAPSARRRAIVSAIGYGLLLGVPVAVAMIVLAEPLVLALFGDRWRDSAPVVQVLGIIALWTPISFVVGNAYKVSGRVDVLLKLSLPQFGLLVTLLAIFVSRGIVAVAACQAVTRGVFLIIVLFLCTRLLEVSARDLWNVAWRPLAAGAAMAAPMLVLEHVIASPWPALLAGGGAGAAVYVAVVWLLAPDAFPQLWAIATGNREPAARREAVS